MQWVETKCKLWVNRECYGFWANEASCHNCLIVCHWTSPMPTKADQTWIKQGNWCFCCLLIGHKHTLAGSSPASLLDTNMYSFYPQWHGFKLFPNLSSLVMLAVGSRFNLPCCTKWPLWQGCRADLFTGECFWRGGIVLSRAGKAKWAYRQQPWEQSRYTELKYSGYCINSF